MAKAELKGQPKVVLTLTEREASFLSYVLRNCVYWGASDLAEEISDALLRGASIGEGDRFDWVEEYSADLDMFEVQEVEK